MPTNDPGNERTTHHSLISTGVPGLDDVLGGGLTPRRLYLFEGTPGAGKTTIAMQFLRDGVARGESVLYVTLSETGDELRGVAESHGWNIDGIHVRELMPVQETLDPDDQYTMFHPSEIELNEKTQRILDDVEALKPTRVVFDSLSELRLLAGTSLRFRRQILALKHFFATRSCTVLLLDDMTATEHDLQVQSIAHAVLRLEQVSPDYGAERRRLMVMKYRGKRFRGGYHDYKIVPGGLVVFPRLVASEHPGEFPQGKLPSNVAALDALLGGGIERGTSTLIVGAPGTGKSTLAMQYAIAAASREECAAVYLFDETIATLRSRCAGLGMNLEPYIASRHVQLRQVDPAELSPGELVHEIRRAVTRDHATVVIIDSLNGYLNAMPNERFLIVQLHELLTFLGQSGVATLLIGAQHGLIGTAMQSPVEASYLADAVVMMRYFELKGEVRQAISVIKKRGGRHERTIREVALTAGGIQVGEPLRGFRGILTGVPVPIESGSLAPVTAAAALEQRVLLRTLTVRDGEMTGEVLARAGMVAHACVTMTDLVHEIRRGAGAILIAEEMLLDPGIRAVAALLREQPAWSDVPVIVLARPGADSQAISHVTDLLANVTVIERPLRIPALVTTVRSALRARRRQYELRETLDGLRTADRRKDEFLATLAHELRNPLAPLSTALSLLSRHQPDPAQTKRYFALMERQVQHMVRLIDDLLEVSRITRGKIALKPSEIALDRVLRDAIDLSRPLIDAARHRLEVDVPAGDWRLHGDGVRLAQVFANVLNNAAKYTPAGGCVAVTLDRVGDAARVRIRDDGIGVPREMLDDIFGMFVQVSDTASVAQGGLGIGLTLVRSLVELHGGEVTATSDGPGRGTEVTIRLPLAPAPADALANARDGLTGEASLNARVLVVDDNRDAADTLADLLEMAGARTSVAYDGPSGLAAAGESKPDVIVLDIGMPGMDGCEVARRLRADPAHRDVRLVALTGWGQPDDRARIAAAGFDHHFLKPVDIGQLITAIGAAP